MRRFGSVRRLHRKKFITLGVVLLTVLAGCGGVIDGLPDNSTGVEAQETTASPEPTDTPEPEPTAEPTPEQTAEQTEVSPDGTDAGAGDGAGDDGLGGTGTLLLFAAGALLVIGLLAGLALRRGGGQSTESQPATESTASPPQPDAERVIRTLHQNNERVFVDVLEEELGWSPAHTKRVLDGLVATGDIELVESEQGTLVVFADD